MSIEYSNKFKTNTQDFNNPKLNKVLIKLNNFPKKMYKYYFSTNMKIQTTCQRTFLLI